MQGDLERLSFMYQDVPASRRLVLSRAQQTELTEPEARDVIASLEKIRLNEPEIVHAISNPIHDRAQGRLAISLAVHGTHEVLHARAAAWVDELGGDPLQRRWAISH